MFRVFHVFRVFRVFRVFPSSEPPKTIKRNTTVYNVQPTAIGVLYNYNVTTIDVQKQVQELLCCEGTPTSGRSRRCGGARGDVDTVPEIRAGKVPMIPVS